MNLKKIIIHQIDKEEGTIATTTHSKAELPITDLEVKFIKDVKAAYYRRSNPIFGTFDKQTESYPFQVMLDEYLKGEESFYNFTTRAADHLEEQIKDIHKATGGYLVIAHYEEASNEFIMVVMLNNKTQFNVNSNLGIVEILSVNIDKLDVANTINITRWRNNEDTYLSFAKGRKDVSVYFRKFIGCTDQSTAIQSSKNLKRAINDYLNGLNIPKEEKDRIKNDIFGYCNDRINQKKDISLHHVSSLIDDTNPTEFIEFASTEKYQVSSNIKGHKKTLRSLKFYIYRSKELILEFDQDLLDTKKIIYNPKTEELTIKEVPESLKNELNAAVGEDNLELA